MAMSCEWLDKLINKNNPNPTPTPGPDSGLVNPNPSNPTPAPAPVPTPEVKPEEKEGYVIYKSTNEDYLKRITLIILANWVITPWNCPMRFIIVKNENYTET
ncbi:hypothetical protein [Metamycoplasma hominis]|uniref:hypothetical protein n=1 Tax=Metamycoplasma hominis TaxID=2098 RepID=UPI001E30707B|nr:hypothetical protein [Metamycoplasma hominis]